MSDSLHQRLTEHHTRAAAMDQQIVAGTPKLRGVPDIAPAVLHGVDAVLRMQPQLVALADRCGLPGVADYIHFFLTQPYMGGKTPTLILFSDNGTCSGHLLAAVLLHQYNKFGMPLGIFVTEDSGGERNVIAPASLLPETALHAVRFLLACKGARLVALSLKDADFGFALSHQEPHSEDWMSLPRTLQRYLPLLHTYEETLNSFGAHTRRNFRLYRRRAEAASGPGCVFEPYADMTEAAFLQLNEVSDHKVPLAVAQWRYRSAHSEPGVVFAGLRTRDGKWISIVGGRRHRGIIAIDWQMNCANAANISPTTLMRGYLIEHEISLGTWKMLFEGGTPHPMHSAFRREMVTDLVGAPRSFISSLLMKHICRWLPESNSLRQTLSNPALIRHSPRNAERSRS